MSSRVSIDDLFGKVSLIVDSMTCSTIFKFVDGPFTEAFSNGYWLLLDELNLAQDTVLRAIESALDTGMLTIHNTSSAQEPIIVHRRHKDFRLFATQNPNSGFFTGKREQLSASFLSRFRPMIFKQLPDEEWRQIVETRLLQGFPNQAKILSEHLVCLFNCQIKKALEEKNFDEIGPYTEITIRELLKWINLLIWQKKNGQWPDDIEKQNAILSFGAWCVYGARYRHKGRDQIMKIITDCGWPSASIYSAKFKFNQQKDYSINFDDIQCPASVDIKIDEPKLEWTRIFRLAGLHSIAFNDAIWKKVFQVHTDIRRAILTEAFISSHGIYRIDQVWLWEWLISAARPSKNLPESNELARCGLSMYQSRFRHTEARTIVQSCFEKVFNLKFDTNIQHALSSARPDLPYVLTDRVLAVLKQVCFHLRIKQPILVTGGEACGKSDLLLTLAWLHGKRIHQLNVTPETEPSSLIGQLVPNDTHDENDPDYGKKFIWQHGAVTKAFINGDWVLLDNLATAEPSVLERLNPVLEQDPMLILTERGDINSLPMDSEYQLVATMTPPSTQQQSSISGEATELSPALYNRFAIVHMEDMTFDQTYPCQEELDECKEKGVQCEKELDQLARALLSDETDYRLAVSLCKLIMSFYKNNKQNFPKFTLRNVIRLFDSTYLLHHQNNGKLSFSSALWTAFHVTIANQIKDMPNKGVKIEIIDKVKLLLSKESTEPQSPNFLESIKESPEHILTKSRKEYADAVLGAVACNIPLLLEGPAAVGKTALISYLCKHMKTDSPTGKRLERVNNTDTTTIQDYLGSYLPGSNGFIFQKGALYSAMTNGSWFLADEFNLADPAVMNLLFPLLEGKNSITIPSSGKIISAIPGFHFFATQNDASYANRHRLPDSLRNRFLEIQFGDFPENELSQIIQQREEKGKAKPTCLSENSAKQIAKFYHRILTSSTRITFREIVKWLHRHSIFSPDKELWVTVGVSLLCAKYSHKSNIRKELIGNLNTVWFPPPVEVRNTYVTLPEIEIKVIDQNQVRFTEDELSVDFGPVKLETSDLWNTNNSLKPPETFQRCLIRIAHAVKAHEPILLVGPTSCKSLLVETWSLITGRSNELIKVHLTPDSEAADLIGEITPHSFLDLVKQLPTIAERVVYRAQCLYHTSNDTHELSQEAKLTLNKLFKLIQKDLRKHITEFESEYSKDEKRREQEPGFDDQTVNIGKKIITVSVPVQPSLMGDEVKNLIRSTKHEEDVDLPDDEIGTPMDDFNQPHFSSTIFSRDMPVRVDGDEGDMYDDGLESNDARKSSNIFNDGLELNDITMSSNMCDDGPEDFKIKSSVETMATTADVAVKDETVDDGLYDDGLDILSFVSEKEENKSRAMTEASITDGDQLNLYDDGLPKSSLSATTVNDSTTMARDDNSNKKHVNQTAFPETLMDCVDNLLREFQHLFEHKSFVSFKNDSTLHDYYSRFQSIWEGLIDPSVDRTEPIFLFNDGSVTKAAKHGGILFLEDLDLPSQAVIERLNSMLEPSPTFALTENITSQTNDKTKGQLDIQLSPHFQIFASVHQEHEYQMLKLSPATRSRFTEIHVPAYTEDDMKLLIENELIKHGTGEGQAKTYATAMFSLREKVREEDKKHPPQKLTNDVQLLFRWMDFIFNHHKGISFEERLILGARFFYFDLLPMSEHQSIFDEWASDQYKKYGNIFQPPNQNHGARTVESIANSGINTNFPFEIGGDYIALRYTGVRYSWTSDQNLPTLDELKNRFVDNVQTPTLIIQIARIFAATSSKTPLLLEGPPGIGKTHVVMQVCKLLSKDCERINMSANTSLDQLIGCIIPRCVNGRRMFEWQDGKVLDALKKKRWILFDELNLASPEVLEGLTPLFYRGSNQFRVPLTGESVETSSVLIFATMNPATIGGGRSKLPRSISNLFTTVQLENYKESELSIIVFDLFRSDIGKTIDEKQVSEIFELHKDIKKHVEQGIIGSMGGPYEMNLRDLSKFRDVFRGSIENQMHHFQYINAADNNKPKDDKFDVNQKTSLSIRKFAQVVYTCQFQGQHDFQHVCKLIHTKFKINENLQKWENDCSVDTSIPNVVRIGSVYINTGTDEPNHVLPGLIHTNETIKQLELLAAACQSKRTILLEGDICSRKSSLVVELARVTRNRLVIIPLHENFETSDLIGTWLPTTIHTRDNTLFDKIDKLFKQIIKMLFLVCMPILNRKSNEHVFTELKNIMQQRTISESTSKDGKTENEKIALEQVKTLLEPLNQMVQIPTSVRILVLCYIQQADYFLTKLDYFELKTKDKSEIAFAFVESEFVEAIREGWWILLDNVNSAPPEVLERLNSLTEDNPMLSLYEKSNGQILTQKNGIHQNFRLFTTANLNRIHSNKLSSAFLNRVIKIWLPMIDADIDINSPDSNDLYDLICAQLADVSAGKDLAKLLLLTHATVKKSVKEGKLLYPTDFTVTYRQLEQCIRTMLYHINNQVNPVAACYWSILRSYASLLSSGDHYNYFIYNLDESMKKLKLNDISIFSTAKQIDTKQPLWIQQKNKIQVVLVEIERCIANLIFGIIESIFSLESRSYEANVELLNLFLDEILLRMYPNNSNVHNTKQQINSIETCGHQETTKHAFENCFKFLKQHKIIESPINIQQQTSAKSCIQNLIVKMNDLKYPLDQVCSLLNIFIENTAFSDAKERHSFLERVISVVQTFTNFLASSHLSPSSFDSTHSTLISSFCNQLINLLRPILTFKRKCISYQIFQEPAFVEAQSKFRACMFENLESGLIWAFERAHTAPIMSTHNHFSSLIKDTLKNKHRYSDTLDPIKFYHLLMQWISLQWTFESFLTSSIQDAIQKENCITLSFIIECETKLCCQKLTKQIFSAIQECIQFLPSEPEILRLEKKLAESKTKMDKMQREVDECKAKIERIKKVIADETEKEELDVAPVTTASSTVPKQRAPPERTGSVYDPNSTSADAEERLAKLEQDFVILEKNLRQVKDEHSQNVEQQATKINEANKVRDTFQSSIKTVFTQEDCQFIYRHFQIPNSNQLNQLIELLNNCRQNPSIMQSDNTLDVQGVLKTEFGRELIDSDDILDHPLVLFMCGFFFLPSFTARTSYLRVISSWDELLNQETAIDLRSLKQRHIIFYCPNKNSDECCLLTVQNSARSIKIIMWSFQRNINEDELDQVLSDLPLGKLQRYIEQRALEKIANMSDTDQQTFGVSCLSLLQYDPIWATDSKSVLNSSDLYNQVTRIYWQWKRFSQYSSAKRKELTKVTYQNLIRFESDHKKLIEKQFDDNEWSSIKETLTLLKSYQSSFSTTNNHKLSQDLDNYIQTIQIPNISSQIASLVYIQPLGTKYACVSRINTHVRKFMDSTSSEAQPKFQLLFRFIDDSVRLLKLLTQHVIYGSEFILDKLYEITFGNKTTADNETTFKKKTTSGMIVILENIFRSTVSLIDLNNGIVCARITQSKEIFDEMQKTLNEHFDAMQFTPFISKYNLDNFVAQIAPLFLESCPIIQRLPSRVQPLPSPDRNQQRIDECNNRLNELLRRACTLTIRPHEIIDCIRKTLQQLQSIDVKRETEGRIITILAEEETLKTRLNFYERKLKQETTFNVKVPNLRSITSIDPASVDFDVSRTDTCDRQEDFQEQQKKIKDKISSRSFNQLEQATRLINQQVAHRIWSRALFLLTSNDWFSANSSSSDNLKKLLAPLNNSLTLRLERTLSSASIDTVDDQEKLTIANNITLAYVQFRCNLLKDESEVKRLSNYRVISELSSAMNDWKEVSHVHFLNMFESIKTITHDLAFMQNCVKNYSGVASCCLMPVIFRPQDILCLLVPEQTGVIRTISANYIKIDEYLSDPSLFELTFDKSSLVQLDETTATLNELNINTGLFSFMYDNDPKTSLIDRDKYLYYITENAITISKQLIELCVESDAQKGYLMQLATSVVELFPIQIVSSLVLIILATRSAVAVCEFQHSDRLDLKAIKEIESKIGKLQIELQDLQRKCREYESNMKQLTVERDELIRRLGYIENPALRREIQIQIQELDRKIEQAEEQREKNGRNQNEISKLEEEISQRINNDVGNLEGVLTGNNCKYVQQSLRQFQRFIYNLLIVGCRFTQVQRGSTQNSLDDLLSSNTREQIDPRLPYTEIGLLQLINMSEVQIRSRSESILYQILHSTFGFNTNVFGLIDKLDLSIKTVENLLLPSSYMMIQMWNGIDTLLNSISKNITKDEQKALKNLCEDFSRMTEEKAKLKDEDLFLSEQVKSGLITDLFKHIETLCNVLEKNRSKMKTFCNDVFYLWHVTLKEILRGLIKARKYNIQTILEFNDQERKHFHLLFDKRYSDIKLYDINRLLDKKTILFCASVTNNQQTKYLPKLQKIQMLYSFLLGLIDNLENTVMAMSLEPISCDFLKQLMDRIEKFYADGYDILKVPLIKFINDEMEIDRLLSILDETRRLETTIFRNQVVNSKIYAEKKLDELRSVASKLQKHVDLAKEAYSDWLSACNVLLEIRNEKRRKNRNMLDAVVAAGGHVLSTVRSWLTSSSNNNPILDQYIEKIRDFMRQHQHGTESISVVAPQGPVLQLSELLKKGGGRADNTLQRHKIKKSPNFIEIKIICFISIPQITLQFVGKNKEYASIQLPLTDHKDNIYNFIIDKTIDILLITLENNNVHNIEWSKIFKTPIELNAGNGRIMSLEARDVHNETVYTVVGHSQMLPKFDETIKLEKEIDYYLCQELDNQNNHHKYDEDQREMNQSPVTVYLREMQRIYDSVASTMNRKLLLHIPELNTAHELAELCEQLPTLETLCGAQTNIEMKGYALPDYILEILECNVDEKQDIKKQYTTAMKCAFDKGRKCKEQMRLTLDRCIWLLCDVRVQLLVTYTWASSMTNDTSSESEKITNMFLEEMEQLYNLSIKKNENCNRIKAWAKSMTSDTKSESEKIMDDLSKENEQIYSLLQQTNENSNQIHTWAKTTQQARYIYKTTNQTANKWQEIYYLMSIPLAIEQNVQNAFVHSKSAGDAHVWLHFPDKSSQQSNNICCEPQLAYVDFGIVLSGIRQRVTQRIILHNETDKNVNIQIELHRDSSTHCEFDFMPDRMTVPMQDAGEIDVLFKSPDNFQDKITQMLDLKINDKTMPNAIQLCVHMIKADLEIGPDAAKFDQDNKEFWTIDFGPVPCCSLPIPKSIELKNLLDCTLNVKAQIQTNERPYHSKLDIIKDELILDGKTTAALSLKLRPSENNIDEDFEATVCLAISPSKTIKWLKVKACIRRPRLSIAYRNRLLIGSLSSPMTLTISDFYIGEHRCIPFEFKNIGETDFEFSLKSQDLTWKYEHTSLKMNESTAVTIEIRLSTQASRTKFLIPIRLVNTKYYYTLEIICETSTPRLDLPAKITKIIEISQAAHLQMLCHGEDKSLKSIIFEGTFQNRSKSVATLFFCQFISKSEQNIKFRMEPDNLTIAPDTDVKVNFVYQPIDLCDLKGDIQLQSNCWSQPKTIDCSLEVKRPIFQSRPQAMIEWGKIENGRIIRPLLMIKNKGAKVLRFQSDSAKLQQPFVKVASINRPSGSINHPIEINPYAEDFFDINIDCESVESTAQTASPIELAELNLTSLRDPVMSIDGQLKERSMKILVVGHLSDVDLPRQLSEKAFKEWKDLRLIPSSWVRDMAMNRTMFEPYSLLITMTTAAL
ncbi:unnamed protein product [Rotaria sp. Silwood2]|nr:unnamed protein product [Rotaria sp. Silwood2]